MAGPASAIVMPRAHAVVFAIADLVTSFVPACLDNSRCSSAILYSRRLIRQRVSDHVISGLGAERSMTASRGDDILFALYRITHRR